MNRRLVLIEVLDELDDAALVEEGVVAIVALVLDDDLEALVEEGHLAQPVRQGVERERDLLEDLRVRLEADDGAVLGRLVAGGDVPLRHAVLIALRPHTALPAYLDLEPLRQGIDHGDADAVQAAGDLVRGVLELASGVQHRQDDFRRRAPAFLVRFHRNAAPVVAHGARAVRVENDLDAVTIARERLIDRIVDGFVDEVMEAVGPRVADVHRGALSNRLQPLEDLDITRVVAIRAHAAPRKAA